MRPNETLKHVCRDGTVKLDAYLDDYAAFTLALIDLHTVTGEQRWLERASQLADEMIARLWDSDGAFFYTQESESSEHLLIRTKGGFDGAVPSGNSLAVMALSRLLAAGQERYLAYLAGIFRAYAARLEQYPIALVTMTEGLSRYHAADSPRQVALPNVTIDNLQAVARNDALPASGNPGGGKLPKSDQYVSIQAELKQVTVDRYQLDTILQISDGWHINANPASLDFLIPTTIRAEIDGRPITPAVDYPAGHEIEADLGEPITVYSGITHIPVQVAASADDPEQVRILARVQACNDQGRCLLPATVTTSVSTIR